MTQVIKVSPRGVGHNGGWASLVTGEMVEHGPDLSMFVEDRSQAYVLVDWVSPISDGKRVDRAQVDYRPSQPNHLQVKLIVEPEHEEVLQRLCLALQLRDGCLDERLIRWARYPLDNREPWGHHIHSLLKNARVVEKDDA